MFNVQSFIMQISIEWVRKRAHKRFIHRSIKYHSIQIFCSMHVITELNDDDRIVWYANIENHSIISYK